MTHDEDMKRCFCSPSYVCSRCIVAKRKTESAAAPHTAAPVAEQLAFDAWWANVRRAEDAHQAAEVMRQAEDYADWQRVHAVDNGRTVDAEGAPTFDGTPEVAASRFRLRDAIDALARSTDAPSEPLSCGHPATLMLKSAETGEDLYCELCDAQSARRDAEARESELSIALAAALATPPADSTSTSWAMSEAEYDRMVNGLMAQLGEISEALGISEEDQSCANGNDAILAAIEDLKQPAPATSTPCASGEVAKLTADRDYWVRMADDSDQKREAAETERDALRVLLRSLRIDLGVISNARSRRNELIADASEKITEALAATQAPAVPAPVVRVALTADKPGYDGITLVPFRAADDMSKWLHIRHPAGDTNVPIRQSRDVALWDLLDSIARTPAAGNTEDARSMGAVSLLREVRPHLDDPRLFESETKGRQRGETSQAHMDRISSDMEANEVLRELRARIDAALTQAASTGGAAS